MMRLRSLVSLGRVIEGLIITVLGAGCLALAAWVSHKWPFAKPHHPVHLTVECDAPSRLLPGTLVTLAYNIESRSAIDVGLGAGLYDKAGVDRSTGIGDRDSLPLQVGPNRLTRPFEVPRGLPAGRYELDAEIWPANKVGADGVETLADSPCAFVTIR
jgi:hypothetical protein